MPHGPARLESPAVLQELRNRLAIFDQRVRNALMGCSSDVQDAQSWLRGDRMLYWKHQLRAREEALMAAKQECAQAQWASGRDVKTVSVEAQRALEKAKRRKEEAEQKLETVKRWTVLLDQRVAKLMGPCQALSSAMDQGIPRAMARLDQMLNHLEEYFRPPPGDAT